MKITISKTNLLKEVNFASRGLPRVPQLPILTNFKLEAKGSFFYVTATNISDILIESKQTANIEKEGQSLVSGKLFSDIIKSLPEEEIKIEQEKNELNIKTNKTHFSLPIIPNENFPEITKEDEEVAKISTLDLIHAVTQTATAAAKDDSSPILTTIKIELIDNEAILSAIDRYRIAKKIIKNKISSPEKLTFLIKAKNIIEVVKGLENEEEIIIYRNKQDKIFFITENNKASITEISGNFPATEQLFKDQYVNNILIRKKDLIEAITRNTLTTDIEKGITLKIKENTIKIQSAEEERYFAEEEIEAKYQGEEILIKFNPTFLKEGLSQIDEEYINIKIDDSTKPVEICGIEKPEGQENKDYKYIIVPIRRT